MLKQPLRFTAILSGIMVLLIFSGCKKSTYYELTDEDMAWLVYKNNEINRFTNSTNASTFFIVTLRTKSYKVEGDTYREFTTATFNQQNDTTAILPEDSWGQLLIEKNEEGLNVKLSWPHFPLFQVPLTTMFPTVATIGGIDYPDVYVVDGSAFTSTRKNIARIWYSKKKGVIQYEDTSGMIWVRTL